MNSSNWRHVGALWRFDLRSAMQDARGILFLVCFGLFWAFWINKLSSGFARDLQDPQIGMVLGWFFDNHIIDLLQHRAPTLVTCYYIGLTATPAFAILAACDQTASDLTSRYLRFLVVRVGRFEVYLARFLGAATLVGAAQAAVGLCAVGLSLWLDTGTRGGELGSTLGYGLTATLSLVAYGTSFVALMALVSAVINNPALSAVAGLVGYTIFLMLVSVASDRSPTVGLLRYLFPSGVKANLLSPDVGSLALGVAVQPIYTAVFFAAGWFLFRKKDV
ncbi:ABC transporter permease [Myxococcota bacterium]|nr:ABC transporter permease [Myxococcota bacterium]